MRSRLNLTRVLVWDAALIALAVALATVFHSLAPGLAKVLVPAWYGGVVGAALFGPLHGMLIGFFTFLFSFLLRGMPPYPMWLILGVELAIYGFFWGIAWGVLGRLALVGDVLAYLSGLFAGKVVAGLVLWALSASIGADIGFWTVAFTWTMSTLPGIVIMAFLIPFILKPLRRMWVMNE